MAEKMVLRSVHVKFDIWEKLKERAGKLEVPVSYLVRVAIKEYLERVEK